MAIVISGGLFNNRKISAVKNIRPTSSRIRESLFNIIKGSIKDAKILDLFAGAGTLGFESISRGAKFCLFTDVAINSIKSIRENAQILKCTDKVKIVKSDYRAVINNLINTKDIDIDIVFVDPPYELTSKFKDSDVFINCRELVVKTNAIKVLIFEIPSQDIALDNISILDVLPDIRKFGTSMILIYNF